MNWQIALIGVGAGMCVGAAQADVLHSTQGVRNTYDAADFNCIVGDTHAQVADDFAVPQGEVWSIEQVVVDYISITFAQPDSALVEFYADADGRPADAPLASLTVSSLLRSQYSDPIFGMTGVQLTADLGDSPVELAAGRYWVTMQPQSGQAFYSIRDSGRPIAGEVHARDVSGTPIYGHASWGILGGTMSVGLLGTAAACVADFNGDGTVNTLDVLAFLNAWNADEISADINGDGEINTLDVLLFLNLWNAGC